MRGWNGFQTVLRLSSDLRFLMMQRPGLQAGTPMAGFSPRTDTPT